MQSELRSVFPAWAGMNRDVILHLTRPTSVPRVGGDEPRLQYDNATEAGVFPAWAGMNRFGASHRK